ncbi:MAG: hypothetical protein KDD60_07335 [Bdellovibrionales bacterium]|nr:hypothetical protein [Bdellovibrionales bacterium]
MSGGRTTSRVLMVEPRGFRSNEETVIDNVFQIEATSQSSRVLEERAIREFGGLVALLRDYGMNVNVFTPSVACDSPDVVFPAHWFSTHVQLGGVHVVYPMRSPKRRTERSEEIREFLRRRYPICIDLTAYDSRGEYLEAMGSLVPDRMSRLVYLAASTRSSERLAERWSTMLGYRLVVFDASDVDGRPIFHTSAVLCVGTTFVVVCSEAISRESYRVLKAELSYGQRDIIEISREQMMAFAANIVQLGNDGGGFLVMSTGAYEAFSPDQIARLERHGRILHTALSTIETYGGASVQSMVAELY